MKSFFLVLTLLLPQDTTAPLVRSSTHVVLLDVVVSDKSGHPLRTLTQDDFTILEDGQPQKMSSFEAPLSADSSVQPNSPRTIILLDELNAAFADLSFARDKILQFLAQNHLDQTPTALMTLNLHGISLLKDYTQDAKVLKDSLSQFRPALINPVDGEHQQDKIQEHAQKTIDSLVDLARATVGSPYNLNVIWVTPGFAGSLYDPKDPHAAQTGPRKLANLLMTARIRLYSIDPSGVHPLPVTGVATPMTDKLSVGNMEPSANNNDDLASQGTAYEANQFLALLTSMTGGHAYYERNDVDIALSQAVNDGAANYLLSYSPSNHDYKGEYRKIEIRTNIPGVVARTRSGYYAVGDDSAPTQELREARWTAALSSPLVYSAFALTCPVAYDEATMHATGSFTVKPTPFIMQTEPQSRENIRVAAIAGSGAILQNWSWQIDWQKTWTNRVTTAKFDKILPKKTQRVRFLVSDPDATHIGTCDWQR